MEHWVEKVCEELLQVKSVQTYTEKIETVLNELQEKGYSREAVNMERYAVISENRFSKRATEENLQRTIGEVVRCLKNIPFSENNELTQKQAVTLTKRMLEQFPAYCRNLYQKSPHGKCSDSFKTQFRHLKIENEYDLQHMIYPVFRAVFSDVRIEETEDSGHHTVRKDIVIDSQDIAIELKYTRRTMTERVLSEEVAADMVHYSNRYLFFYIYDPANIIQNAESFQKTYEEKNVEGKTVFVIIQQEKVL